MSRQTVTETVPFEYEQVTCDVCQQVISKGQRRSACAVCGRDLCGSCLEWRVILYLSSHGDERELCTRCLADYEAFNSTLVFLTDQYDKAVDRVLADWRERSLHKQEEKQ